MTPEEKAMELVLEYLKVKTHQMFNGWWHKMTAKQCALIAVDECLKTCVFSMIYYWQEVKEEIEKL